MKVVAFKIFERQNQLLRTLVEQGVYSSISEPLRQASWELLRIIMAPLEYGENLRIVQLPKEFSLQFTSKTVSVSGKFPLKMIEMIDWLVAKLDTYKNRSNFLRDALTGFLVTDSQLFSSFILGDSGIK